MRPNTVHAKAIHASVRGRKVLSGSACETKHCPCQDNPCECEGPLLSEAARETKHCPCQGNFCECEGP